MAKEDTRKYFWWRGVIEDRVNDPLKMGNLRVRIFEIHPFLEDGTPDTALLPTEKLPWAQVATPLNGVKTFCSPREGDWVFGTFFDGPNGQMPLVLGVIPGVDNAETMVQPAGTPQPPSGVIVRKEDEPSISRPSRGIIEGTMIEKTNNDIASVCDISGEVQQFIGLLDTAFGTILQDLRKFWKKVIDALGDDRSGIYRKLIETADKANETIKKFKKIGQNIMEVFKKVTEFIETAKNMASFILSLPAKIVGFIQACAAEALNSTVGTVMGNFKNMPGIVGDSLQSMAKSLVKSGEDIISSVGEFLTPPELPGGILNNFLDPKSKNTGFVDSFKKILDATFPIPELPFDLEGLLREVMG
ncbi:MAG: hypothetical protein PHS04_00025 [Tissierellia bacterium]|nr:hypothetical protein [Tissierellia bacterium]